MHPNTPFDDLFHVLVPPARPLRSAWIWWTAGNPMPYHDPLAYVTPLQWKTAIHNRMHRGLQSLHFKPPWDSFLVFDIDVRSTTRGAASRGASLGCAHAPDDPICPKCWPIAQAACFLAEEWLTKRFGLRPPLTVFSGSGGVHLWYKLYDDDDTAIAFNSARVRETLVKIWEEEPLPAALAEAIPLYQCADAVQWRPHLDRGVTAEARHAIRTPFSRNEKTGRYALPLPHSLTPVEWPAIDNIEAATLALRAAFPTS